MGNKKARRPKPAGQTKERVVAVILGVVSGLIANLITGLVQSLFS